MQDPTPIEILGKLSPVAMRAYMNHRAEVTRKSRGASPANEGQTVDRYWSSGGAAVFNVHADVVQAGSQGGREQR